jgi:hypothetical protein
MSETVKISPLADRRLAELSVKRKKEESTIRSKRDIIGELIRKAHKRECK